MTGERAMARYRRQAPRPPTFIRDEIAIGDADREGRPRVEEIVVDVIVIDHDERVGAPSTEPPGGEREGVEQRFPSWLARHAAVVGVRDRRRMRASHSRDDDSHRAASFYGLSGCPSEGSTASGRLRRFCASIKPRNSPSLIPRIAAPIWSRLTPSTAPSFVSR